MPTYNFSCHKCESVFEAYIPMAESEADCKCGEKAKKLFSPTTNFIIPLYMQAQNENSRARYKQWLDKPETKAKIRKGIYDVESK